MNTAALDIHVEGRGLLLLAIYQTAEMGIGESCNAHFHSYQINKNGLVTEEEIIRIIECRTKHKLCIIKRRN